MLDLIIFSYENNPFFTYYVWFIVIILGLVVGSFLNVVGIRFLENENIVFPASKCPKCKTKLKWYDNIPVLAYVLLRGKCRYCKEKISIQYPIVETITSLIFFFIFFKFGFSLVTPMLWILASASIVMCITDFKEQVVFDIISIPLIPIGLIYSFFNIGNMNTKYIPLFSTKFQISEIFLSAIIGIVLAFLIFETISLISKLLIKHRAFGEGDTIIAMGFAAWLGWKAILIIIPLAILVQSVLTLPFMITKLIKTKDKKAITSFSILALSLLMPFIINSISIFHNPILSMLGIILTFTIAISGAIVFLSRMKELALYTLLPFGPALIIAGFVVLFYQSEILKFLNF